MVHLNPDRPFAKDEASACATAGAIVRDMAARAADGGFVAHPYPVTPWHGDYLLHADLAEAARTAGHKLSHFNMEQQGDLDRDYYLRQRWGESCEAWEPFIREMR